MQSPPARPHTARRRSRRSYSSSERRKTHHVRKFATAITKKNRNDDHKKRDTHALQRTVVLLTGLAPCPPALHRSAPLCTALHRSAPLPPLSLPQRLVVGIVPARRHQQHK